jgi:hypothetical protein
MKLHLERWLYVVTAILSGVAPVVLDPLTTELAMAAINLAMAFCVPRR